MFDDLFATVVVSLLLYEGLFANESIDSERLLLTVKATGEERERNKSKTSIKGRRVSVWIVLFIMPLRRDAALCCLCNVRFPNSGAFSSAKRPPCLLI
jgi:hypothetical protein